MSNRITGTACALALALLALAAAAQATSPDFYKGSFGARDLRMGDRGTDVKTLNWALRAGAMGTPVHGTFSGSTDRAVRTLQRDTGLRTNGVVARKTRKAIAGRMVRQRATWYGPGFWGNRTACGRKLTKKTVGVAHRKLPCGTKVVFAYRGRWARAKVIDRGPYRAGYRWDLTRALAKRLGAIKTGAPTLKAGVAP